MDERIVARILVVDDSPEIIDLVRLTLEDIGCEVMVATSGERALETVQRQLPELILLDVVMPGIDGFETCRRLKQDERTQAISVIFLTGLNDVEHLAAGFAAGGADYITKPFRKEEVLLRVEMHLERARLARALVEQNAALQQEIAQRQQLSRRVSQLSEQEDQRWGLADFVGESRSVQNILEEISLLAEAHHTSVLITGESGTGKELLAKAIHQLSPRSRHPMVTVHCAALSPTLLESELFGHEKGAFTGAHERRVGRFEQAEGGTLFLDEIGEIDETTQVKLLRFLGERTFERVGGNKTLTADVRVVAATNKNLKEMVGKGEFREDLFFRLGVVELWAPPLRERASDIPMLALSFLREFAEENAKPVSDFTAEALEAIIRYAWPGNVRELRTAVEHAVVLAKGDMIELAGLPQSVQSRGVIHHEKQLTQPLVDKGVTLEEAEKQLIIRTLKECRGNRTTAARKIGISRRTLHRKLNRYGLEGI